MGVNSSPIIDGDPFDVCRIKFKFPILLLVFELAFAITGEELEVEKAEFNKIKFVGVDPETLTGIGI